MHFDPAVFGMGFHEFVQAEYRIFGFLSPVMHLVTAVLMVLIPVFGNRIRRLFTAWFTLNWAFLLGYWGVYGAVYWAGKGLTYLTVYIAAPVLLFFILLEWVKELIRPQLNLDLHLNWRFAVCIPIMLWGFWYPSYVWGEGFSLAFRDLGFSYYGLMPCPTTMLILGLTSLNYPATNRKLFRLMTAYALFIGTATVASGWLPDIPFIILGVFTFTLILINRFSRAGSAAKEAVRL